MLVGKSLAAVFMLQSFVCAYFTSSAGVRKSWGTRLRTIRSSKSSRRNTSLLASTETDITALNPVLVAMEIPLSYVDGQMEYEQFVLPNGIRTTILRDPISEKSACALAVGAGAADDHPEYAGLAHFTEHMLFLGTKKYPNENYYKQFLAKHGGSSNAATGMESTVYQFIVLQGALTGAVEIFSEFFKEPLFSSSATAREVRAVDSEDSKNRIIDGRRGLQVVKSLILPSHKYAKFSTGNAETLARGDPEGNADLVRGVMQDFYRHHYVPSKMGLCLVGPQPLHELRKLAHDFFSDVPDSSPAPDPMHPAITIADGSDSVEGEQSEAFPFVKTGSVLRVKPVQEIRDLAILVALPPVRTHYKSNPSRLLGFLLSHKGEGSLFSRLQARGWASTVSAGTRTSFEDFSIFQISVSLTESGLAQWEEVVGCVYEHIRVIRAASVAELQRVWSEIREMSALEFQFSEKQSPYDLATNLAENMLVYRMEHVMSAGALIDDFPEDLFYSFLSRVCNPGKANIILRSPSFDLPEDFSGALAGRKPSTGNEVYRVEKWYGVPFIETALSDEQLALWQSERDEPSTRLPVPNPFIPSELLHFSFGSLPARKSRSSPPVQLLPQVLSGLQREALWHSYDEAFGHPRTVISILLESPFTSSHPIYSLMGNMFAQATAEKYFPSSFAGLRFSAGIGARGIQFSFAGYSTRLSTFALNVTQRFCSETFWSSMPDEIFVNCKDSMVRGLRGWTKERPDKTCDVFVRFLLQEGSWLPADRLLAAASITKDEVHSALTSALTRSRALTYCHGILTPSEAEAFHEGVRASVGPDITDDALMEFEREHGWGRKPAPRRARMLRAEHTRIVFPGYNQQDENSALVTYFQAQQRSPKTTALVLVIQKFLSEPLFNDLRTNKQLGYIVSMGLSSFGVGMTAVRGFSVRVVSNRFSPWEIENELGRFLSEQRVAMALYSQADVDARVQSLVKSIQDPPTSYMDEASFFWDSIVDETPMNWFELVIAELEGLTIEEVRASADAWLLDAKARKTVSCMSFGNKHHSDINLQQLTSEPVTASSFPSRAACVWLESVDDIRAERDLLSYN